MSDLRFPAALFVTRKARLTSGSNLYLRDLRDPWCVGPGAFGAWIAAAIFAIAFCAGTDWIFQ